MEGMKQISWFEFCQWLVGRRVSKETPGYNLDEVVLDFEDGAQAVLVSRMTEGSRGYSDYTPGSDGHLIMPAVFVREEAS